MRCNKDCPYWGRCVPGGSASLFCEKSLPIDKDPQLVKDDSVYDGTLPPSKLHIENRRWEDGL
jgi:hypothetical protein